MAGLVGYNPPGHPLYFFCNGNTQLITESPLLSHKGAGHTHMYSESQDKGPVINYKCGGGGGGGLPKREGGGGGAACQFLPYKKGRWKKV